MTHVISPCYEDFQFSLLICYGHMGQVRKMRLYCYLVLLSSLTHWGRVMHICVVKLTIIDSDNGLSPERRQAIIWTNAGILLIGPLRTNFSEILIGFQTFSFKKMRLIMSSAKWHPFCLGLNVLKFLGGAHHQGKTTTWNGSRPHRSWRFVILDPFYFMAWISNYTPGFLWDVITHPCNLCHLGPILLHGMD